MPTRLVLLTLLPLLALGGWFLLAHGTDSDEVSSPRERSPAAPGEGPVLDGTRRPGPALPLPNADAAVRAPTSNGPTGSVRIYGDVVLPEGFEAGSGLVAVLDPNAEPQRVLARQALSEGLAFDWSLPYGTERPIWDLRVVLCVHGLPLQGEGLAAYNGGEHRVSVRVPPLLETAPRIEGRLTDHCGRALEGFRFAIAQRVRRAFSGDGLPGGIDDLLRLSSTEAWIVVTTEQDGRFEARTSSTTAHWPVSLDPTWVVQVMSGHLISPGKGPVKLMASPAARVRGHVRDAATGKPIEDHQRTIYLHSGGRILRTYGWGGSDAAFDWATAVTGWGSGPVEIEVQVSARLYAPFEIRLHPGPEGLDESLDIALRPLTPAEIGELVVLVGIHDAQGRPLDFHLAERTEREGMSGAIGLSPERPAAGNEGPAYRMAAGQHLLSIALDGSFGSLMRWKGEVLVPGGTRTLFQVPWPAYGSLRLRYRPRVEGEARLSFNLRHAVADDNVGFDPEVASRETLIPALPAGSWVLTDHGHTPATERTFEIAPGAETVIDVEP